MTSTTQDKNQQAASKGPGDCRGTTGLRNCRRALRWIEHGLAGVFVAGLVVYVSPLSTWIYLSLDCQDDLRPARYIICLGGDPGRVLEGAKLLEEGYGERLIVSGHGASADLLRDLAVEWGAAADRVLVDDRSARTADHPGSIARHLGVDPATDTCIVVTSYTHLPRAKACFEKAGYRHLVMRELRWQRSSRECPGRGFNLKSRFIASGGLIYEGAAWIEYWIRGLV